MVRLCALRSSFDLEWEILKDGKENEYQRASVSLNIDLEKICLQEEFLKDQNQVEYVEFKDGRVEILF